MDRAAWGRTHYRRQRRAQNIVKVPGVRVNGAAAQKARGVFTEEADLEEPA